jgi:elongation factor Ts
MMATITAKDVNALRQRTGAGMMDCKKALEEANGDFEVAIDILRKKGQKVAAKRGENEAKEGLVMAMSSADSTRGVIVAVNCETDFVAKNADFQSFVERITQVALAENPSSTEELLTKKYDDKLTIAEKIMEQVGVIGEKIEIGSYFPVTGGFVVGYNHPGNQVASIVGLNKGGDLADAGRQVAMQIAAMAPIAIDKDQVDDATIQRELEVGKDLAIQEGKPADVAEKIAQGRLNKFFQENTLLNQAFVRDNKKSVRDFLKEVDKDLTVTDFKRISLS